MSATRSIRLSDDTFGTGAVPEARRSLDEKMLLTAIPIDRRPPDINAVALQRKTIRNTVGALQAALPHMHFPSPFNDHQPATVPTASKTRACFGLWLAELARVGIIWQLF